MEKIVQKIVIFVFSIFVIITFLIYVFSDTFSTKKFCIVFGIAATLFILIKFPVITKWKIKRTWILLIVVIALSLFLRITWIYLVQAIPISDFYTYHSLADALADGEILYPKFISLFPHVFGYSKVLSVIYSIFGSSPVSAVSFNIVINLAIIILIYYIGKILYDEKTGVVSIIIYAFWPSQIFYNSLVLTEPFFTFGILFLIAFYLSVIKHVKSIVWKIPAFLFIGVIAGFLKYIRPAAIILIISFMIHFILLEHKYNESSNRPSTSFSNSKRGNKHISKFNTPPLRDKRLVALRSHFLRNFFNGCNLNTKEKIKEIFVRTGFCILLIISYTITSSLVLSSIENSVGVEMTKKSSGFYILAGLNIESEGRWSAKDSALLESLIDKGLTSEQIHEELTAMGLQRLKTMDMSSFVQLQINKNKHMWGNDSKSIAYIQNSFSPASHINISKHAGWLTFASDGYYFLFLVLSFTTLYLTKMKDAEEISNGSFIFYLYILGTVAAHMLVEIHSRYHYTVIPLLCIPAALLFTRFHLPTLLQRKTNRTNI